MTSTYTTVSTNNTLVFENGRLGIGLAYPGYQLHLTSDSAAKPSTTTWTVSSDRRLKTDIEDADLNRCYEVVHDLPLRRFAWNSNVLPYVRDVRMLGWIAQEVEPYLPNAITRQNMYGLSDAMGLDSDQIFKFMYGALQRTIQRRENLEEKCDALLQRVENLKNKCTTGS